MTHSQHRSSLPHFDLANHSPASTIQMMTQLLERITKTNDKLQASSSSSHHDQRSAYTCFHARSIPTITIHSYLTRILKYCPCTNECFLSLLVYFDRMSRNATGLRIDSFNIHRLVIAGIMVASKFFSDIFFTNTRYAKVGGLPVAELNALELEFLQLNDFNLNVTIEELQQYGDQLLMHWMREEERRRELQWRRKEVDLMMRTRSTSSTSSSSCEDDLDRHHHHHHRYRSSSREHDHQRPYTATLHRKQPTTSPASTTQRHSWHIDHHPTHTTTTTTHQHRLPTPPYIIHP